jgi:CheY-like chemotaxis protein
VGQKLWLRNTFGRKSAEIAVFSHILELEGGTGDDPNLGGYYSVSIYCLCKECLALDITRTSEELAMKRFLLVDDDQHEFMFVNFLLKDRYAEDFTLGYAQNIADAQSYLAKERVDVILLDDRLECGMTSAESIPQLQKAAFNVPIIVISKDIDAKHLKDRRQMGINKVVDKFRFREELARGLLD